MYFEADPNSPITPEPLPNPGPPRRRQPGGEEPKLGKAIGVSLGAFRRKPKFGSVTLGGEDRNTYVAEPVLVELDNVKLIRADPQSC
jgi:hypothetical protein